MCILFIYTDPNPPKGSYRLIIASNRDEFFKRPAKNAYHCEKSGVIAGRDMEVGREYGTWLGVSTQKTADFVYRFGALLNVTGETKTSHKGRGFVVVDYLVEKESIKQYQKRLHEDDNALHSYNFVTVDLGSQVFINHTTNVENEKDVEYSGKQILAFGNSTVTKPLTKVKLGKEYFRSIIDKYNSKQSEEDLIHALLGLLTLKEKHLPDPELQRRAPQGYKDLSSVYVDMNGYGTRTHTIILVDDEWKLQFKEITMKENTRKDNYVKSGIEWEETNILSNP